MGYRKFADDRRRTLHAASRVADTPMGAIEHAEFGPRERISVLLFHGSPGGFDQTLLADDVTTYGHQLIGWSRPGYLRTPLSVGRTFAEQADAAAALLDAIGESSAVAHGVSGGGPSALEFARRHPGRAAGLILECAVTRHYDPEIPAFAKMLFLSRHGTWLATTMAKRWPRAVVNDFVGRESTLDAKARRQIVDWILGDPHRRSIVEILMQSLTPYEDRAAGLDNDLERFAELDDSLTSGVACPTLILHGTHDGDADPAYAHHAA